MAEKKDVWDKLEIISKAISSIFIPFAIAGSVFVWNWNRTLADTRSTMIGIAIGVLTQDPEKVQNDALREWAISVMMNPDKPPVMSQEAADQLRKRKLAPGLSQSLPMIARDFSAQSTFNHSQLCRSIAKIRAVPVSGITWKDPGGQILVKTLRAADIDSMELEVSYTCDRTFLIVPDRHMNDPEKIQILSKLELGGIPIEVISQN